MLFAPDDCTLVVRWRRWALLEVVAALWTLATSLVVVAQRLQWQLATVNRWAESYIEKSSKSRITLCGPSAVTMLLNGEFSSFITGAGCMGRKAELAEIWRRAFDGVDSFIDDFACWCVDWLICGRCCDCFVSAGIVCTMCARGIDAEKYSCFCVKDAIYVEFGTSALVDELLVPTIVASTATPSHFDHWRLRENWYEIVSIKALFAYSSQTVAACYFGDCRMRTIDVDEDWGWSADSSSHHTNAWRRVVLAWIPEREEKQSYFVERNFTDGFNASRETFWYEPPILSRERERFSRRYCLKTCFCRTRRNFTDTRAFWSFRAAVYHWQRYRHCLSCLSYRQLPNLNRHRSGYRSSWT